MTDAGNNDRWVNTSSCTKVAFYITEFEIQNNYLSTTTVALLLFKIHFCKRLNFWKTKVTLIMGKIEIHVGEYKEIIQVQEMKRKI